MLPRLYRGLLAVILLGTLLVPTAASLATPNKKLRKLEKQMENRSEKRGDLESKTSDLKSDIDQLNLKLTDLQIKVNELTESVKVARADLSGARARIQETQDEIDKVQGEATEQAVALYKTGETEVLGTLLDSGSLAELDDQAEMLGLAAEESTYALVRYGRLKVKIRTLNSEEFEKEAHLKGLLEERSDEMVQITKDRRELQAKLGILNKRLGKARNKELLTEKQIAEITGGMVAYEAKSSATALGTSSSGYIWPLNGNVTSYYGYRWGRTHSGIDIDGYTGQPIVAAKGGKVVLASYYSGYGQAVIIDHGGGYKTLYAHLSRFGTSNGASIGQGDLVGYVGCTGSCTGDHLHFEVRVNDSPTDPMPYLP